MTWARIAIKDLRVEARSRETLVPVLLMGLLVVAVGVLSYHDVREREAVASGILWTGLSFAGALGLARAFGSEADRGTLDTLLALPVDRSSLYLGKTVASFALVLLCALVVLPGYLLASGDAVSAYWPGLALLVVLGSLGLAATGTMLSILTAQARSRDILLPVLLFPLLAPLLIATVHGTLDVLSDAPFAAWRPEVLLLAGYDVAFLAASALLFEAATEA